MRLMDVIEFDLDLPDHADIIIDALIDNEIGAKRNRYDSAIAETVSWTLSCTPANSDVKTPIISIDLPSNTDPDTGERYLLQDWDRTLH